MVFVPISTPMIGVALFSSPNTRCLLMRSTVGFLPVEQGCQVPGDQVISRNSCDICAHGHGGAKGHRIFSSLLEEYHENDPCRRPDDERPVSYTHLRAHETSHDLVCRLLLE